VNLSANPEVQVQVKGDRFAAHARTATVEEKPELWKIMTAAWPDYDQYQERTDREIPVVILTRD
jgi:deazaflavin-dependent oxidoreductase (nitroreductase family)